eukprot:Rmarinus@m.16356
MSAALTVLGCLLVAHGCYSTIQERQVMKSHGLELADVPSDIVVEMLLGCFLLLVDVARSNVFKPILASAASSAKTFDQLELFDFMTFDHRGAVLAAGEKNK